MSREGRHDRVYTSGAGRELGSPTQARSRRGERVSAGRELLGAKGAWHPARELWDVLWGRGSPASEGVRAGEPEVPAVNLVNTKLRFAPF